MPTFRIGEAAELLGVSPDTARRWVDGGRLPAARDENGHRYIAGRDLAAFAQTLADTDERERAALLLGVPLAWLLARARIPARALVRSLVTVPLVLPPVVAGIALLLVFGRHGILGGYLDRWFGVTLPFPTPGVVVAESFVALPYLVVSVESALRAADP